MHPIAIPLLATHPSHICLSCMATWPPPLHLYSYVATPLQLHSPIAAPLAATLATSPCAQLHGHIAASLIATHVTAPMPPAWATLQHALQLNALHHCPHQSHTCHIATAQATSPPLQLHSVAVHLTAGLATSPPPSQLHTPCCCVPHS